MFGKKLRERSWHQDKKFVFNGEDNIALRDYPGNSVSEG